MMTGLDGEGIFAGQASPSLESLDEGVPAICVAGRWWAGGEPLSAPPPPLVDLARRALSAGGAISTRHEGRSWIARGLACPGPALVLHRPSVSAHAVEGGVREALERTPLAPACASSPSLAPLGHLLGRIAPTRLPVLLLGETGTGKEVVARALHDASGRHGDFVAENCAALPDALVESELFGVRRGAFTGAANDRRGRIRQAGRGTLFLDEIGDLPLPAQAKLLRVLQEGEVRALGADRAETVDIRVVAATHRDLRSRATGGLFREDLYYRLAGFELRIPPLRERRPDLPFLVAHLLARLRGEGVRVSGIREDALELLADDPFRGNVRDLDNRLRRAAALSRGPLIERADLAQCLEAAGASPLNLEARAILDALELSAGVKSDAARRLGWSRQKLYRRLARLGIDASCRGSRIQSP